jgi:hypothetical protein
LNGAVVERFDDWPPYIFVGETEIIGVVSAELTITSDVPV